MRSGELTTNTAGTDTPSLNQSLETLSQTIDQIAHNWDTFDGLSRLSSSLNMAAAGLEICWKRATSSRC